MKIQRTIPPSAAPINLGSLLHGLAGVFFRKRYLERLEREIKEYFGVKHVFLVSSGKAALTLILLALKSLKPDKKEVLIPAYTCFSVPSAIVKAGLKVSLCDIGPSTFDFEYNRFNKSINKDTLCVIPDHLFGIPANMDRINSLCKERGIFVVEDAAQAMGGSYNGKKLGTIGDIGFFSLGRGKNITCGSGGIIVTNSDKIADAITLHYSSLESPNLLEDVLDSIKFIFMAIFIHPSLFWFPAGLSFLKLGETIFCKDFPIKRLSGMQTGLLRCWQRQLKESNRIRKENSEYFSERLRLRLRLSNGTSTPFLRLPFTTESREIKERIYSLSEKMGIGISCMYPTPINEIEEIQNQFNGKTYPSAKRVAETLLTIPTHHLLSRKDKERISSQLSAVSIQHSEADGCLLKAER